MLLKVREWTVISPAKNYQNSRKKIINVLYYDDTETALAPFNVTHPVCTHEQFLILKIYINHRTWLIARPFTLKTYWFNYSTDPLNVRGLWVTASSFCSLYCQSTNDSPIASPSCGWANTRMISTLKK